MEGNLTTKPIVDEKALACSDLVGSPIPAETVLANCTTTLPMRGMFDGGDRSNKVCFGSTSSGMSCLFNNSDIGGVTP